MKLNDNENEILNIAKTISENTTDKYEKVIKVMAKAINQNTRHCIVKLDLSKREIEPDDMKMLQKLKKLNLHSFLANPIDISQCHLNLFTRDIDKSNQTDRMNRSDIISYFFLENLQ